MGFKLFKKGEYGERSVATNTVSLNKASISIGDDFKEFLTAKGNAYVEIYTDKEQKMVAIKPSNDKRIAFPLRWEGRRGSASIPFIRRAKVQKGVYEAKIKGDMLLCENVIFLEEEQTQEVEEFTFEE